MFVYDDDSVQVGYTTSYMYSPDAAAPHRPGPGATGACRARARRVRLEIDVNHRYEYVTARTARLPLYNPSRKTA